MNQIYNNLTIDNLIRTEQFKQLDKDKKKEILNNSDWFNQFGKYQQEEILIGLEEKLDVSIYAKKEFNWEQMIQIREGLKNNIDVSIYAKTDFTGGQMFYIRSGLEDNLDVSVYAKPEYSWREMFVIQEKLLEESTL